MPSKELVSWAQDIVEAFEKQEREGKGAFTIGG